MLTWRGPALMLFARTAFAVGAQAVVAASSPCEFHRLHGMTLGHGYQCTGAWLTLDAWHSCGGSHVAKVSACRSRRLQACRPPPRCAARLRTHAGEPRIYSWWQLCSELAGVRDTHAAVPLWTPSIAGRLSMACWYSLSFGGWPRRWTYDSYLVQGFQVPYRSTSVTIAVVGFAWLIQRLSCRWPLTPSSWCFGPCRSAVLRLRNAFVSAPSQVGSAGDCARTHGLCECVDRCASSVGEGM